LCEYLRILPPLFEKYLQSRIPFVTIFAIICIELFLTKIACVRVNFVLPLFSFIFDTPSIEFSYPFFNLMDTVVWLCVWILKLKTRTLKTTSNNNITLANDTCLLIDDKNKKQKNTYS